MCGRYASSSRPEDLVEEFDVVENLVRTPLAPDFNVAPTKEAYVVLERPEGRDPDGALRPGARQLRTLRWGLVPSWATERSIGARLVNARWETAAQKPSFRTAVRSRRCVVPADGYYEWYVADRTGAGHAGADHAGTGQPRQPGKPRKPAKQPFFITPRDGSVLAMAGLYEIWRDPALPAEHPHPFLWTFTVLTTNAIDELGRVHDRMPLLVTPETIRPWLDPTFSEVTALASLVRPAAPGLLEAYPVSPAVGNVRNNGPQLLERLPVEHDLPVGVESNDPQLSLILEEDA